MQTGEQEENNAIRRVRRRQKMAELKLSEYVEANQVKKVDKEQFIQKRKHELEAERVLGSWELPRVIQVRNKKIQTILGISNSIFNLFVSFITLEALTICTFLLYLILYCSSFIP